MFKELCALLEGKKTVTLVLSGNSEQMVVTVIPKADDNAPKVRPLQVTGSADELDAGFVPSVLSYKEEIQGLSTNLETIKKEAKAATDAAKAEADKKKSTPAAAATTTGKKRGGRKPKTPPKDEPSPPPDDDTTTDDGGEDEEAAEEASETTPPAAAPAATPPPAAPSPQGGLFDDFTVD